MTICAVDIFLHREKIKMIEYSNLFYLQDNNVFLDIQKLDISIC